jgi:ribonucleoside-diphosphate reductase subunit M1
MFVIKRNGTTEEMKFDKITKRVRALCVGLDPTINPTKVTQQVATGVKNNMTTQDMDDYASNVAASMTWIHPDYSILAGRIASSNLRKVINLPFSGAMEKLYNHHNKKGKHEPIISGETWDIIQRHKKIIDDAIVNERDMDYDYFGFETLRRSYFLRIDDDILETPQYMIMRYSIGMVGDDIDQIIDTYDILSQRLYTHATPTMFNAGTPRSQMASCFLIAMKDDSIEGIFDTIKECAQISKYAGGIGLHAHNIRSTGAHISSTNGESSGLVPFLRIFNQASMAPGLVPYVSVFNETAVAVDQAGRRNGAIAVYLEMHHPDIEMFIELRKNTGAPEHRTRDLFLALWMSDYFMEREMNDEDWSLFDPDECPGLSDVYGQDYIDLYLKYEGEGKAKRVVKARELWVQVLAAQIETGVPYVLNKDQINKKSNQKNLGTIKSSNLCAEIVEFTSPDETAVCHLASICLPRFFRDDGTYDFNKLSDIASKAIKNLNKVIDRGFYPVETARRSSMRNRPLGLGVSGLHDVFHIMKIAFDSDEAYEMNKMIFETIYRGAIKQSIEEAKEHGPYETFWGSPASKGVFQFDMWDEFDKNNLMWHDWEQIRSDMMKYGLRNSLLTAEMPTASSATIAGVNECFEIQTSNLYSRKVLSGEFTVVNKYLVKELQELGLWTPAMSKLILSNSGSVQDIETIPNDIQKRYRTVWEYSMKVVIDMAADRGPFVCQTQSMNLYYKKPTIKKMNSVLHYAHKKKLKTIMYYLHGRASSEAASTTTGNDISNDGGGTVDDDDGCVMCSA